ncbi:MAG TPA: hypothetical protein DCZ03_13370 [Gammaproteobacteria bacterium]|nr:hypothetical protein [Gammaproteobacteria bacterium]
MIEQPFPAQRIPHHASIGLLIFISCLTLASCALGINNNFQPPAIYYFDISFSDAAEKVRNQNTSLSVALPRAHPGFESRHIVYQRTAHRLEHYTQSEWVARPTEMLGPLLVRSLEQTGYFDSVIEAPSNMATDYRLETELIRLIQVFDNEHAYIHLVLRMHLLDMEKKKIVTSQLIDIKKPSPTLDAIGGVKATNAAIKEALLEINRYCAQTILEL